MDTKNSPFSLYDLIGYFIPGASLLLGASYVLDANGHSWLYKRVWEIDSLEKYLPFFLAAYVTGQANGLVSSLTIERYAIYSHGYPSKTLLNLRHQGFWRSAGKKMGLVIATLLMPIAALDWLLGRVFGLAEFSGRPLDRFLDAVLRRRIYRLLRTFNYGDKITKHGNAGSSEFFRLVYHYAVENAPAHLPKMQNYVALFGFFRAFALIALLGFWAQTFFSIRTVDLSLRIDWEAIFLCVGYGVLAYMFFVGFLKFYRRFSLEALMAAAVQFEPPRAFTEAKKRASQVETGSG